MSAAIASDFETKVSPAFQQLLHAKHRFRTLDVINLPSEQLKEELANLERLEKDVMRIWAESTQDINPGMLAEVEAGKCNYTGAVETYLYKVLAN